MTAAVTAQENMAHLQETRASATATFLLSQPLSTDLRECDRGDLIGVNVSTGSFRSQRQLRLCHQPL